MLGFSYLAEHNRYLNIVGIFVILLIAWLFSKKRHAISLRLVFSALLLQFGIAVLVLKTGWGIKGLEAVSSVVQQIYLCADAGASFVFGALADQSGPWGFIFAIKALSAIVFFGALMSLLFYFGIVQLAVSAIAFLLRPILGTSGAETLCVISNSFLGQTEAPLLVRGYLKNMTKSEFMLVMMSGMATISGALMVVLGSFGVPMPHILASSVMAIPASILISKIFFPETEQSKTAAGAKVKFEEKASNMFDAIFLGTRDGFQLALNVAAMLISFLALLYCLDLLFGFSIQQVNYYVLAKLGFVFRIPMFTLGTLFSYLFSPFAYLLGFSGDELFKAGELLGTKVAVNELVAYGKMLDMGLSERTVNIMTYALCGFSNFSCIGIQVGGISALVPEKRQWLTELGIYAVFGAVLANLLSAMVASLLL